MHRLVIYNIIISLGINASKILKIGLYKSML